MERVSSFLFVPDDYNMGLDVGEAPVNLESLVASVLDGRCPVM